MEINATNLTTLILDTIDELKRLQGIWKDEFRDVPPVLWFGNLNEKQTPLKGRVLVVSANPSRPEQPKRNPRIPYSKKWNIDQPDVEEWCHTGRSPCLSHISTIVATNSPAFSGWMIVMSGCFARYVSQSEKQVYRGLSLL